MRCARDFNRSPTRIGCSSPAASNPAYTGVRIETDPQRFGQILKNLLSNAFKFTTQGEVGLRVFPPQPGSVAFAVRDTGVGIAPHQQEVIFEAFRSRLTAAFTATFGGTGLGLVDFQGDLASLLGGAITVQSEPGVGSVFTLTLAGRYALEADARFAGAGATHGRQPTGAGAIPHATPRAAGERRPSRRGTPAEKVPSDDDRDAIAPERTGDPVGGG